MSGWRLAIGLEKKMGTGLVSMKMDWFRFIDLDDRSSIYERII